MDKFEKDANHLWRIYKTVHQMLHDRGYVVGQDRLDMTLREFMTTYRSEGETSIDRNAMELTVHKEKDPSDKLLVSFPIETTLGVSPIRTYFEKMHTQNVHRAILIIRNNITPSAVKIIASLSPKFIIEQFLEKELLINITEHELVPPHILLTSEEKKEFLRESRLKEIQLPRILTTDPVARYYGFTRGQVIKIIRKSATVGRCVSYRYVM